MCVVENVPSAVDIAMGGMMVLVVALVEAESKSCESLRRIEGLEDGDGDGRCRS